MIYIFPKKQKVSRNLGEKIFISTDDEDNGIMENKYLESSQRSKRKVRTLACCPKKKGPGAKRQESV